MPKEILSQELAKFAPEDIGATCASLRKLTQNRVMRLPEEVRESVEAVTFSAQRKGKPLSDEANIKEIKVGQIFSPWILVELKDAIGTRHIRYALNEEGEMRSMGDFTPHSEEPSSELGDELVSNMAFYEPLLETAACTISIKV